MSRIRFQRTDRDGVYSVWVDSECVGLADKLREGCWIAWGPDGGRMGEWNSRKDVGEALAEWYGPEAKKSA